MNHRVMLSTPLLVLAVLIGLSAHSETVAFMPVPGFVDGDFETNSVPAGQDSYLPNNPTDPLPWGVGGTQTWQLFALDNASPYLVNNSGTPQRFPSGIPSGTNAVTLVHPPLPDFPNSNSFYQIFSIGTFEANSLYRLSGMFGYDAVAVDVDGHTPISAEVSLAHGPTYDPLTVTTILGDEPSDTPAVGSFVPFEIFLDTQAVPDAVGKDILVRIAANPTINGVLTTTSWDDLKLDVEIIPEPSTLMLLAAGLLGLPACARRKRK